jgi:aspartyl-tRNA(Asn)/glutamyl-tRNA(Gln) amidotransferase subunit B
MEFEAVIGLEIHVQLNTLSKAFCGDSTAFGQSPNTQVSAISLGHPGTLPKHNIKAIEAAAKLGIALKCNINRVNQYARKNYFYADLPKGYQITQDKTPICTGGFVEITTENGKKKIGLTRIHMEEDSGKSMHDQDMYDTLVDFNRAGIPLVEIVSEPVIKSGDEAYAFLYEIRRLVRYLDICDGNMEEGSLRCDANISIMPKGSQTFGTKVEVKNMNSMTNVKRAIAFEIERQTQCALKGEKITSETRSFNAATGTTTSMRSKEEAQDYRYFPEPDLPPFVISDIFLQTITSEIPTLPSELVHHFVHDLSISETDAAIIAEDKTMARFFMELYPQIAVPKNASNWLLGPVKSWMNEHAKGIHEFPLTTQQLASLIQMVEQQHISHSAASTGVFPHLLQHPNEHPQSIAIAMDLMMKNNSGETEQWIQETLQAFPEKVMEYKNGKKGLIGLFVGEVMKKSGGAANPKQVNDLLRHILDSDS